MSLDAAVDRLRATHTAMQDDPPASIQEKAAVLEEYQPRFQPDAIQTLSEAEFQEFLLFENNRHWTGLHRKRSMMTADMERLRTGLQTLLDDQRDLADRVQETKETVDGMGKATISAVLVTAYPEAYGVWNNRSEEALKQLDVWPDFEYGMAFGERYRRVNDVLLDLSNELDLDLWDLDAVLGYLVDSEADQLETEPDSEASGEFVKERHLQQYLVNHWDQIGFSDEWEIYSDADDPAAGVEFSTGIGRPDLLLTHTSESRVCVVELKRGGTSDRAVGQLLRYIGWVDAHLDELEGVDSGAKVEGRLIVNDASEKLAYAVEAIPRVTLYQYEMEVRLQETS